MSSNEHLIKAKIKKDDEFYTSYSDVCTIFKGIADDPEMTVFVLPCDSFENKSNFIKYCLDHSYDFIMMDDFHEMKNINPQKHRIEVVTNPPFSKLKDFLEAYDELEKKVSPSWVVNLTFICPQVLSRTIFKKYFKNFMTYNCLSRFFTKTDGTVGDACVNLISTHQNAAWYHDPFDFTQQKYFKLTKDAMVAVYTKQVHNYFYVTRGAISEQCFFKQHGWIIDYESEYNRKLKKDENFKGEVVAFGMLKFVQDPNYEGDDIYE